MFLAGVDTWQEIQARQPFETRRRNMVRYGMGNEEDTDPTLDPNCEKKKTKTKRASTWRDSMSLWKTKFQLRMVSDRTVGDSFKDVGVRVGGIADQTVASKVLGGREESG